MSSGLAPSQELGKGEKKGPSLPQLPEPGGACMDKQGGERRPHLDGKALTLRFVVSHQHVAALSREVVVQPVKCLHVVLPPGPADAVPLRAGVIH